VKVLVVLGDGGHTVETLKVVEALGPIYEYSYLTPKGDLISEGRIRIAGPMYRASLPRTKYTGFLTNLRLFVKCAFQEFVILLKVRPKAILSAGAGIAVPVSILGRLLGVKVIYVESATRIAALSLTGKILYRVAHLFLVQWESLREDYPKAIYAGRLL
jgi:beta-1,4-N-acetylglucosaminyltransferase